MAQNIRSASIAVSILLAALIVYTFALRYREREVPRAPDLDLIPAAAGGYVSADERQDANDLEMLGADKTLFRTYRRGWDNPVWLCIGYFGSQRENSQQQNHGHQNVCKTESASHAGREQWYSLHLLTRRDGHCQLHDPPA